MFSVQRRHQKLIEEAPSPVLSAEERAHMGELVAKAAAAVGYVGAGTVEFLRSPQGELFFIEMNTRLQVEHPVTEELTGIDLVEAQLRVAAGERLWFSQEDITWSGHSIECRLNAEDPDQDFRPDAGVIEALALGAAPEGLRVRLDTHVTPGYRIPPWYDSMVGKLIVHAADRDAARVGMIAALRALRLEGVRSTVPLHARVLASEPFASGDYDTRLVPTLLEG